MKGDVNSNAIQTEPHRARPELYLKGSTFSIDNLGRLRSTIERPIARGVFHSEGWPACCLTLGGARTLSVGEVGCIEQGDCLVVHRLKQKETVRFANYSN